MKRARKRSKLSLRQPLPLLLVTAGVAVVLLGTAYAIHRMNHRSGVTLVSASPTPTLLPSTPAPSQGPGSDTAQHAGPGTNTPSPTTPTPITDPNHPVTNTLSVTVTVSSHQVSRGTMVDSTCITVVGAKCHIQATSGSTSVTVSDTKTVVDQNGVDLPWDTSKLPSAGTWNIQAVAVANDGRQGTSSAEVIQVTQ